MKWLKLPFSTMKGFEKRNFKVHSFQRLRTFEALKTTTKSLAAVVIHSHRDELASISYTTQQRPPMPTK
jgi:hypothetical protein